MQSEDRSCCAKGDAAARQPEEIKEFLKERYGGLVADRGEDSCCAATGDEVDAKVALSSGYTEEQLVQVPEHAAAYAFGCGNPVALAGIEPGQTVLDIGSGAGIDVFLAASKVGPKGRVIGLDLTPEMIEAAKQNAAQAGIENVEFRLGDAEDIPVESGSVDWIISNCVINLAPDKEEVFREAYRVLRSGGRVLISDIVTRDLPEEVRRSAKAWAGCIAGAVEEETYLEAMRRAGFSEVEVVARVDYDEDTIRAWLAGADDLLADSAVISQALGGRISSIKVGAVKE